MIAYEEVKKSFSKILDKAKSGVVVSLLAMVSTPVVAQSLESARTLAEDGDINGAISMLQSIVGENPQDAASTLFLGELLWDSGHDADAVAVFENLRKGGNRDAILQLARIAYMRYEVEKARELLAAYRKTLRKGKKQIAEDLSGSLEDQIDKVEGMLDRVQNIEVIDSVDVDAEEFFKYYPISPAAGHFVSGNELPEGFPADSRTMAHMTESRGRMVWSGPDDEGNDRLYGSYALLGGEWESPEPLGDSLAEGGDALYPFLMPDGTTLYFSNDGENSLGGHDIYLAREGDDGFLQPANLGMPFNSPYNDYLLVIDEFTGAGWFATDRNRHPGKVTIYTFIPQDLRVNVDIDDPNLASLARLDNVSLTRKPEKDYDKVRTEIAMGRQMSSEERKSSEGFMFAMPGNRCYTSLDDFRNPQARNAMGEYLAKLRKFENITDRMDMIREEYGKGDHSQAAMILELESQMDNARAELKAMRNEIIKLEIP